LNGSISSFDGSGGCRLCMICFRFSGAVVSVGMIIGIFVVAGINHWLSFLGSTIRIEERGEIKITTLLPLQSDNRVISS